MSTQKTRAVLVRMPDGLPWRRISSARARRLVEKGIATVTSEGSLELTLRREPHRDREHTPYGLPRDSASISANARVVELFAEGVEFASVALGGWKSKLIGKEASHETPRPTEGPAITFFEHDLEHRGRNGQLQQCSGNCGNPKIEDLP